MFTFDTSVLVAPQGLISIGGVVAGGSGGGGRKLVGANASLLKKITFKQVFSIFRASLVRAAEKLIAPWGTENASAGIPSLRFP